MSELWLSLRGIDKQFPGVRALHAVSLDVAAGSCHALVGENGAGKSTLGKILAGIYTPDAGVITLAGRSVHFRSPREAHLAGIAMVHQELALCENLTVAENLNLGRLPRRGPFLDWHAMEKRAGAALRDIEAAVPVHSVLADLPVSQQQLVQIAGAIAGGARLLIFDEPTSSLSRPEVEHLFILIRRLQRQGVTALYISHRLEEIFELCDAVTVLRDGEVVGTHPVGAVNRDQLVQMMIGRRLVTPPAAVRPSAPVPSLRVEDFSSPGHFEDVSFTVHTGEVLGLAGLVGAGRSALLQALFGLDRRATGRVLLDGRAVRLRSPRTAMRHGLGLVPEDRKRLGLILSLTARENISLPILSSLARCGWIRRRRERRLAEHYFHQLRVRAPSVDTPALVLSGGNQQKVVLAKWLAARCRILLLDEPTRGVDVGAKAEIHTLIRELAREGSAVLFASSELPEILKLADRILVMRHGRLVGQLPRDAADEERLLRLMAGVEPSGG